MGTQDEGARGWSQEAPRGVAVVMADGRRVDLEVVRANTPGEWTASPPGDQELFLGTGDRLCIAFLPAGQAVQFLRVYADEGNDLLLSHDGAPSPVRVRPSAGEGA